MDQGGVAGVGWTPQAPVWCPLQPPTVDCGIPCVLLGCVTRAHCAGCLWAPRPVVEKRGGVSGVGRKNGMN